jgi:hypothetical protein
MLRLSRWLRSLVADAAAQRRRRWRRGLDCFGLPHEMNSGCTILQRMGDPGFWTAWRVASPGAGLADPDMAIERLIATIDVERGRRNDRGRLIRSDFGAIKSRACI